MRRHKVIPALLIVAGGAGLAAAVGSDLVGVGGQAGFGRKQMTLALAGAVLLSSGAVLITPPAQRYLRALGQTDVPPAGPMLIAAWFGLFAGLGESLVWLVRKFTLGQVINMGLDVFWIVTLLDLLLFTGLGLVLSLVDWRWPKRLSLQVVAFVFAFLASLDGILLLFPRLHRFAGVLLAAGLSVQIAHFIAAHPAGFHRTVRFMLGWPIILSRRARQPPPQGDAPTDGLNYQPGRRQFLVGAGSAVAGLAVGTWGWRRLAEQLALNKLPPSPTEAPNVLLIVLDTVRAQSLSLHGYERPTTPQLERMAKTGVCFDRAISTSPWTLPSHASMFTGRWPYELSADWQIPLDNTYPTLAEVLSTNGYLTAGFVANTFYCSYEYGLSRGFAHYEDYRVSPGQAVLYSTLGRTLVEDLKLGESFATHENFGRKSAAQLNSDFLDWLSRNKGERPFFAFLNYLDAHGPFLPPRDFALGFSNEQPRGFVTPELANSLDAQGLRELTDAYDGSISYLDHHIGLLFDELEARGVLDNTLLIVTSDHGEHFGDHRLIGHGNSLYLSLTHVPLLVIFPGRIPANVRVPQPVTLRDLAATIMGITGFDSIAPFPGRTLARHWTTLSGAPRSEEEIVLSHVIINWDINQVPMIKGRMTSLIARGMHYIRNPDGREELYEFVNDPWETQDLVGLEEKREVLKAFRSSFESMPGLTLSKGPSNG